MRKSHAASDLRMGRSFAGRRTQGFHICGSDGRTTSVQQQAEFITPQAGNEVGSLSSPRQPAANVAQNLVACDVAKTIIDRFEVIQVKQRQADGTVA
jgi:hypothetical protein